MSDTLGTRHFCYACAGSEYKDGEMICTDQKGEFKGLPIKNILCSPCYHPKTMEKRIEESNRMAYDRDMKNHDCGYWSVCDDHGCPCAIDQNVNGFDNKVYEE